MKFNSRTMKILEYRLFEWCHSHGAQWSETTTTKKTKKF